MGPGFFGGLFNFNGDGELDAIERAVNFCMFCEAVAGNEDSGLGDKSIDDDLEDAGFNLR